MAANTCTSSTGTAAGTDPNFTVTQNVKNRDKGCFLYLKYTIGTSGGLTITVTTKSSSGYLTSTDAYSIVQLSTNALSALTYTIAAAGNYKIPIPLSQHDDTIVVSIVAGSAAADAAIVANILMA